MFCGIPTGHAAQGAGKTTLTTLRPAGWLTTNLAASRWIITWSPGDDPPRCGRIRWISTAGQLAISAEEVVEQRRFAGTEKTGEQRDPSEYRKERFRAERL